MAGVPAKDRAILTAAAKADGIPSVSEVGIEQLKEAVRGGRPSLIFLGDALPDPVALCAEIRALPGEHAKETPIIIVANQSHVPVDKSEPVGVTDVVGPAHQHDGDAQLLGRLGGTRDDLTGGVVAPHGVDGDGEGAHRASG